MSKLTQIVKSKSKKRFSSSQTVSTEIKTDKRPPKGAKILNKTIRTEVEEIDNGWLTSKNFDVTWEDDKGERQYSYYSDKHFSAQDPVKLVFNDKALADSFQEDLDGDKDNI